jgi:DNA-directed DNA polymerase III PolC
VIRLPMIRTILHLDADAFFASVEQAADARLRGKPVAVGGEKRGIIASASYEARKFGVYTPMPTVMARRLCPRLIILPGDFAKYEFFSRLMFSYAYDFTPDVEIGSIDEGYFDLTGARHPAFNIAQTIRRAIRQSLKLSVSEGVGSNKLISQIASKLEKPAAFHLVPPGEEAKFLSPLANQWLPGIGPKTANQLNAAGLARIGQIAHTPAGLLSLLVGGLAPQLRNFALGLDERPVVPARAPAKSYGEQETFSADTTDQPFLEASLRRMADQLMAKVREDGKSIRTLTVKIRYNDMDEEQAGESLDEPTDLETEIYSNVSLLLRKAWKRRVSLRLVSLKLSNVYDGRFRSALGLDCSARQRDAQQRLAGVVDELRQKFGRRVLLRGHDFILRARNGAGEEPKPGANVSRPGRTVSPISNRPRARPPQTCELKESSPAFNSINSFNLFNFPASPSILPAIGLAQAGGSAKEGLAVVQRQRLGHDAMRLPSEGKARSIAAPHAPRLTHQAIPLNVHSYYSFLDSTLSINAIVELAKRHQLPAIALTDKNNLHGAVEFAQAAAKAGIKLIIGVELDWQGRRVCLYVQNKTGYHNLCRILSEIGGGERVGDLSRLGGGERNLPEAKARYGSSERGRVSHWRPFARPAHWDHEPEERKCLLPLLPQGRRGLGRGGRLLAHPFPSVHGDGKDQTEIGSSMFTLFDTAGLLALSPCAELAQFFPGRFYLEINSLEAFEKRSPHHSTLPCIASSPIHYELPSDRWKYDIVQSIRTLTLLRQQHPAKRLDGECHFRPPAEMQNLFAAHPKLAAHSLELAERCSFEFSLGKPQFPGYEPPDGSPPAEFLRRLVMEGLQRRYPKKHACLKPQLEEELAIITEVGYQEYFLVVWDILQECRRRGIEWITRGSAADSLACYCLEISGVCPIRFDLYFRRFLNKDRMALNKLPDIDVDFPHDRKDDVIDLIFEKYGPAKAAIVGGFSTFQSRSAFAEVAKVLGVSEFQVRRITERLPNYSRASELTEAVAGSQECGDLPLEEEPYRTALQMARFLDGFPRYPKMHPCGLVLSGQPMDEITPCFISAKGYPTTHFDMDSIEAVGLVKMDILAQGGLAVMRDVKEMIQTPALRSAAVPAAGSRGVPAPCPHTPHRPAELLACNLSLLEPWTDAEIWKLIASGQARAVHHIESPAMISLCKMCGVKDIDTLIAIVSVIRPGAANESKKMEFARRYQGLSPVRYPHPSLKPCLRSTYGLVVYEEHILQICEAFAGLPPGRADVLRRALAKDKTDIIDQIQTEFADCARQQGRGETEIAEVWDLVVGFKGYAFCKAHSTAYGVEAYQSAWLKLHYPAEFMAAVLANGKGFYDPLVYVLECHRLGISLLPPWVNEPGPHFTVVEDASPAAARSAAVKKIRAPALNVKGLTSRAKETILRERARGPFVSLRDFFLRVQPLNEEMESLIQAGAFDGFGKPRTTQYWEFKSLARPSAKIAPHSAHSARQLWLLPSENLDRLPSVPLAEPARLQHLRWEEELLGYPVSGHPLELYPDIAWDTYCPVNRVEAHLGEQIVTCGLVIEQRLFHQITGEPMKFITIADWTGVIETELFARTYKSYGLNTVRYRVLEITATVEPFENGRGCTLRVLRAGKPRTRK